MRFDDASQDILAHLYHHFRDSATDIAKATGLKRHQVSYRLDKFADEDLIDRFVTLYNYPKLGYNHFHVVWLDCSDTDAVREALRDSYNVLTYGDLLSDHDLFVNFIHESEAAFEDDLHGFLYDHEDVIDDYTVFNVTFFEFYDLKEFGEKDYTTVRLVEHTEPASVDETDKAILKLLEDDARKDIVDIAQATGLSSTAVIKRLDALQDDDVIQTGRALLNMEKLGYSWGEIHVKFRTLAPSAKQRIVRFCRSHPHVNMVNLGVADYNGIIQVLYRSDAALRRTVRDVREELGDNMAKHRLVLAENEGVVRTLPFESFDVV